MKKSLRLLVTLDCNFSCGYCCNKLPSVSSRFATLKLEEIDFSKYADICITGGEPFIYHKFTKQLAT